MCPLYPFHLILLYLCLLLPLLFAVVEGAEEFSKWNLTFLPKSVDQLQEYNTTQAQLHCYDCKIPDHLDTDPKLQVALSTDDPHIASLEHERDLGIGDEDANSQGILIDLQKSDYAANGSHWSITFNITGRFLGFTKINAQIKNAETNNVIKSTDETNRLPVSIVRKKTLKSKIFGYSVALLISLAYINMGCAMDLSIVRETLRRPIGPLIGFVCQYMIMPLIAFGLGYVFYDQPAMRLGLFVTGASPGGGASNIWTLMFGGNLNLSITMTAISTFAAFVMMPAWIFTLGRVIFSEGQLVIPFYKICTYAVCLVVPLGIGLAISKWCPKLSKVLVKMLKPMSLFLILFILIFGVWANLYMFKIMTWQVWLTGMALPWLGFAFGCTLARLSGRPAEDTIAIAIETGVQNTGVSIFMLWFTFDHPLGDLAAVVPVAAATMTPFPLLASLTFLKIRSWYRGTSPKHQHVPTNEKGDQEEEEDLEQEDPDKIDFRQSESSQRLMPIVKKGGCALTTDPNGNI